MKLKKPEIINQLAYHLTVYGLILDGDTLRKDNHTEPVRFQDGRTLDIYIGSHKVVELREPYTDATMRRTARYINDYWQAVKK